MPTDAARAALCGAAAGAAGTLAMDLLWYSRYRRSGGPDGFVPWELSVGTEDFEHAATPAKVGRRIARDVAHVDLPDSAAALANDVVHWGTGVQWGVLYGLATTFGAKPGLRSGAAVGVLACSTSYVVLPMLDLYEPIWAYDARTLARDYSAHLLFGLVAGIALRVLTGRPGEATRHPRTPKGPSSRRR